MEGRGMDADGDYGEEGDEGEEGEDDMDDYEDESLQQSNAHPYPRGGGGDGLE